MQTHTSRSILHPVRLDFNLKKLRRNYCRTCLGLGFHPHFSDRAEKWHRTGEQHRTFRTKTWIYKRWRHCTCVVQPNQLAGSQDNPVCNWFKNIWGFVPGMGSWQALPFPFVSESTRHDKTTTSKCRDKCRSPYLSGPTVRSYAWRVKWSLKSRLWVWRLYGVGYHV